MNEGFKCEDIREQYRLKDYIMMPGILIGGIDASGRKVDIAYIDYWSAITQEGTVADVKLATVKPKAYADGMFGFDFARVNPEPLGVGMDAASIQQVWDKLEEEGFPLEELMKGLVIWDIIEAVRGIPSQTPGHVHHYYGTTPSFARLVELLGHIGEIRGFKPEYHEGFESRLAQFRRNLKGIFKGKSLEEAQQIDYLRAVKEAGIALTSKESEFNALKQLLALGYSCRLPRSGADFHIIDKGNLRCEVKSRHENIFQNLVSKGQEEGIIGPDPVSLLPESVFALLSWSTFATIRRAMDEQESQILFCDLSHTFVGLLLPAIEHFWNINLDFSQAVQRGLELSAGGNQVVIVFISLPGVNHHLKATTFLRRDIEPMVKVMWDMNKQLALHSPRLAKFLADVFNAIPHNKPP